MVGLLIAYPFIEAKITGDKAHHNLLQRPRDVPVRSGLGAMALTFFILATISGGNDLIAYHFQISLNAMTWFGRIGLIVLPPIAYFMTYRICIGLQRADREVLEHGIETGVIKQMPNGAFVEVHQPLGPVDEHGHPIPLRYQGAKVPHQMNELGFADPETYGSLIKADPEHIQEKKRRIAAQNHEEEVETLRNLNEANKEIDRKKGELD